MLPRIQKSIKNRILKRKVKGVWIGVSCASWTRARRAPINSKLPSALRGDSPGTIWGLPGLSQLDQERVKGGNRTALFAFKVFKWCLDAKVPCIIENPLTSRLWLVPKFRALIDHCVSKDLGGEVVFNHCGFGSKFCKPTKLVMCHIDLTPLAKRCKPGPVCIFSGLPHEVLSGTDGKCFKTASASAYPIEFCKQFAKLII